MSLADPEFRIAQSSDADAMAYAQVLLGIARRHIDGIDDADILAIRPESPTSLAAHNLSNIGGSCHGGEFALDDGTVIPGWLDYRTDVPGLYLTGSTSSGLSIISPSSKWTWRIRSASRSR